MSGNAHVRCEAGENPKMISKDYLSLSHVRPDGSIKCVTPDGSIDPFMMNEFGITPNMIDPQLAKANKEIKVNNPYVHAENLGSGTTGSTNFAEISLTGWQNSPGHDAALLKDFSQYGSSQYTGISFYYNKNNNTFVSCYDVVAFDWIDYVAPTPTPTPTPTPDPVEPDADWYPGKDIDYDALGFTLSDIPLDYRDWVSDELDMDPEDYGDASYMGYAMLHWLWDHGVPQGSNLEVQIEADYYANLSTDDFIRYMITEYIQRYAYVDAEFILDMTKMEQQMAKSYILDAVADKLGVNHWSRLNEPGNCVICGEDHTTHRDYNEADAILEDFFLREYGINFTAFG